MSAPRPAWIGQSIRSAERRVIRNVVLAAVATAGAILIFTSLAHSAEPGIVTCNQQGCSDWQGGTKRAHVRAPRKPSRVVRVDANGNSVVRSQSGVAVKVASDARAALQCIVDHVEAAGVRVKAMRGYGAGTVRGSLHPAGRALDINQTDRDVTWPPVPRRVSNAAADKCGVISGARWGYADNGHWNLAVHGRTTQEPWPRVVQRNSTVTP